MRGTADLEGQWNPGLYVCLMVDKLESVLEIGARLTPIAMEIRREVRSGRDSQIDFQKSKDFAAVVDLRDTQLACDALWHMQARYGKKADKIELLHTGDKGYSEMLGVISKVYADDPEALPLRRTDLCCDLSDITVPTLARSVRANYKRIERQYGQIEVKDTEGRVVDFMAISGKKLGTLQFGARPNVIRIYDKVDETFVRYKQAKRRAEWEAASGLAGVLMKNAGIPLGDRDLTRAISKRAKRPAAVMLDFPSFEEWSGLWQFQILTRVERQIGGKLPLLISTVRGLRDNALTFNPFENLKFPAHGPELAEQCLTLGPVEELAVMQIKHLLGSGEWTMQQLMKHLNRGKFGKRGGHAIKYMEKFARYIQAEPAPDDRVIDISSSDLFDRYRESMKRQLAA